MSAEFFTLLAGSAENLRTVYEALKTPKERLSFLVSLINVPSSSNLAEEDQPAPRFTTRPPAETLRLFLGFLWEEKIDDCYDLKDAAIGLLLNEYPWSLDSKEDKEGLSVIFRYLQDIAPPSGHPVYWARDLWPLLRFYEKRRGTETLLKLFSYFYREYFSRFLGSLVATDNIMPQELRAIIQRKGLKLNRNSFGSLGNLPYEFIEILAEENSLRLVNLEEQLFRSKGLRRTKRLLDLFVNRDYDRQVKAFIYDKHKKIFERIPEDEREGYRSEWKSSPALHLLLLPHFNKHQIEALLDEEDEGSHTWPIWYLISKMEPSPQQERALKYVQAHPSDFTEERYENWLEHYAGMDE